MFGSHKSNTIYRDAIYSHRLPEEQLWKKYEKKLIPYTLAVGQSLLSTNEFVQIDQIDPRTFKKGHWSYQEGGGGGLPFPCLCIGIGIYLRSNTTSPALSLSSLKEVLRIFI